MFFALLGKFVKYSGFPMILFLVGILVGDIWRSAGAGIVGVILLVLIVFLLKKRFILLLSAVAVFVGYFYAVHTIDHYEHQRKILGDMVGWEAFTHTIEGTAAELLSVSEFSHSYRVRVLEIDKKVITPFDISLILPPNLSVQEGDEVTAVGKFSFPRDTPEYAQEKQLWNRGIVASFRAFHTDKKIPDIYSPFVRLRIWFSDRLSQLFPQVGHDILSGILLGQKNTLSPELKNMLKASGLMHIMVVSGGNVIMLIIFLSLFIRALHPWIRIGIVLITTLSFVFLVGGDAPVWRAAMMGVIGYSASLWGYRFRPLLLPFLVASILAFINPLSLVYDIGLQLSFLSVICIIAFGQKLTRAFSFLGRFFDEAMAMTVAATIGTFPITVFYFGTFSLVGPIANLFAAPAIPILMYGGILTLFSSLLSSSLAYYIGFIPWVAVTYLTEVITFFGSTSWSLVAIELGDYSAEFMFVSMFLLAIFIMQFSLKK